MRKRHRENPIKIGNTQVPFYNEIKYLGITIPNELNLEKHINKTFSRLQPAIRTLQLFNGKNTQLSKQTRVHINKTPTRSSLTYATQLHLNFQKTKKRELERKKESKPLLFTTTLYTPNKTHASLFGTLDISTFIENLSRRYENRTLSRNHSQPSQEYNSQLSRRHPNLGSSCNSTLRNNLTINQTKSPHSKMDHYQ